MSAPCNLSPQDQGDLRWFWNSADGELGFRSTSGGDFERAASHMELVSEPCSECRGAIGQRRDGQRRSRRAQCPACHGLGVAATMYVHASQGGGQREALFERNDFARKRYRFVREALRVMAERHVLTLHAVYGPAPRQCGAASPATALVLWAMNTSLPERRRIAVMKLLKVGNVDRFTLGPARKRADSLLSAASRAYDRARRGVLEPEREETREHLDALKEGNEALAGAA